MSQPIYAGPVPTVYDLTLEQLTDRLVAWGEPPIAPSSSGPSCGSARRPTTRCPICRRRCASGSRRHCPLGRRGPRRAHADRGATRKALLRLGGAHVVEAVLMGYRRPRDGLHVLAGGVRDGVHVLRDRPDGSEEQPDGRRDRGAGGVGAPRGGEPPGHHPAATERTSCSWGWGSRSRTSGTSSRRSGRSPLADAFGIGARHVTVSTVGLAPGIRRLATAHPQVGLAVSFHAASDELRSELVPPNDRWPLAELERAIEEWRTATRRRPSIEWALIDRVNDTEEQAALLAPIARRLHAHVNLIPLNPTPGYPVVGLPAGADPPRSSRRSRRTAST